VICLAAQVEDRYREAQPSADGVLRAGRDDMDRAGERVLVRRRPEGIPLGRRDGRVIIADELRVALADAAADAELKLFNGVLRSEERTRIDAAQEVRGAVDLRPVLPVARRHLERVSEARI